MIKWSEIKVFGKTFFFHFIQQAHSYFSLWIPTTKQFFDYSHQSDHFLLVFSNKVFTGTQTCTKQSCKHLIISKLQRSGTRRSGSTLKWLKKWLMCFLIGKIFGESDFFHPSMHPPSILLVPVKGHLDLLEPIPPQPELDSE